MLRYAHTIHVSCNTGWYNNKCVKYETCNKKQLRYKYCFTINAKNEDDYLVQTKTCKLKYRGCLKYSFF